MAIKIQRPNTEDIVALDLFVLRWWAGNFYNNIFSLLGRDINLQSVMDDFGNLLYAEIDVSLVDCILVLSSSKLTCSYCI